MPDLVLWWVQFFCPWIARADHDPRLSHAVSWPLQKTRLTSRTNLSLETPQVPSIQCRLADKRFAGDIASKHCDSRDKPVRGNAAYRIRRNPIRPCREFRRPMAK